jgi:hypothetical protein
VASGLTQESKVRVETRSNQPGEQPLEHPTFAMDDLEALSSVGSEPQQLKVAVSKRTLRHLSLHIQGTTLRSEQRALIRSSFVPARAKVEFAARQTPSSEHNFSSIGASLR